MPLKNDAGSSMDVRQLQCAPDHAERQEGGDEGCGHAKQREQHRHRRHTALLSTITCYRLVRVYQAQYCQTSKHAVNDTSDILWDMQQSQA